MQNLKHVIDYMAAFPLRTPSDIGALIRARRKALGLDQAELAASVGVSRLWINQVERGKPGASLGLVLRTLAAVGIDLAGRVPGEEIPEAPRVFAPDINQIIADARRKERP